jgi:hypothetical protein
MVVTASSRLIEAAKGPCAVLAEHQEATWETKGKSTSRGGKGREPHWPNITVTTIVGIDQSKTLMSGH